MRLKHASVSADERGQSRHWKPPPCDNNSGTVVSGRKAGKKTRNQHVETHRKERKAVAHSHGWLAAPRWSRPAMGRNQLSRVAHTATSEGVQQVDAISSLDLRSSHPGSLRRHRLEDFAAEVAVVCVGRVDEVGRARLPTSDRESVRRRPRRKRRLEKGWRRSGRVGEGEITGRAGGLCASR